MIVFNWFGKIECTQNWQWMKSDFHSGFGQFRHVWLKGNIQMANNQHPHNHSSNTLWTQINVQQSTHIMNVLLLFLGDIWNWFLKDSLFVLTLLAFKLLSKQIKKIRKIKLISWRFFSEESPLRCFINHTTNMPFPEWMWPKNQMLWTLNFCLFSDCRMKTNNKEKLYLKTSSSVGPCFLN